MILKVPQITIISSDSLASTDDTPEDHVSCGYFQVQCLLCVQQSAQTVNRLDYLSLA